MIGHQAAEKRNVTLIAFDRPGIGLSEFRDYSSFDEVSEVLLEALGLLGISNFDIITVSGGTPYGVAFANRSVDRVGKLALISPFWNPSDDHIREMTFANRFLLSMGKRYPGLTRAAVGVLGWTWKTFPMFARAWFGAILPSVDRKILLRRSVAPIMNENLAQSLCLGAKGIVKEFTRMTDPWTLSASRVSVPARVWHGTADDYVPLAMARSLADDIPGGTLTLVEGGGHFMLVELLDEVFDWCIEGRTST